MAVLKLTQQIGGLVHWPGSTWPPINHSPPKDILHTPRYIYYLAQAMDCARQVCIHSPDPRRMGVLRGKYLKRQVQLLLRHILRVCIKAMFETTSALHAFRYFHSGITTIKRGIRHIFTTKSPNTVTHNSHHFGHTTITKRQF